MGALAASPPAREAWIEMRSIAAAYCCNSSPPAREAWIEISMCCTAGDILESPPAREAWIEITMPDFGQLRLPVASREGGVD